jgi:hypothetical protein
VVGKMTSKDDVGGLTFGQQLAGAVFGQSDQTVPVTTRRAFSWASEVLANTGTEFPGPFAANRSTGTTVLPFTLGPLHPAASQTRSRTKTDPSLRPDSILVKGNAADREA